MSLIAAWADCNKKLKESENREPVRAPSGFVAGGGREGVATQ